MCGWLNLARAPISCLKNLLVPPLNSFFANLNPNHVVSWTTTNPPLPSNSPPDKSLGLTQKMRGEEVKPLESMAMSEGFTFRISSSCVARHWEDGSHWHLTSSLSHSWFFFKSRKWFLRVSWSCFAVTNKSRYSTTLNFPSHAPLWNTFLANVMDVSKMLQMSFSSQSES